MFIDLVAFGVILLVRTPYTVELSVCMGIFGCGCPNSTSVVHMGTTNCALINSAPNSASAAELITALIICKMSRTALLFRGMSLSLDMKKHPPIGFMPWLRRGMMHHCGL